MLPLPLLLLHVPLSTVQLEQFGAAVTQAMQAVEVAAQDLLRRQVAFTEALLSYTALVGDQYLDQMDVGGVPFHTSMYHRDGGMLSVMWSNDFSPDVHEGGYAFFDRDPTWFPLVLHFLRTSEALLPPKDADREALFREAQFYAVDRLCHAAQL